MKKILLTTIAVATCCLLPMSGARAQQFNAQLANMLQDSLSFYVNAITNIKGMSAAVYLPGQGTWQGTSGLSYAAHPITQDMEFGIASNTKLFVSATILKLVDNNILTLNDHLSQWLPTYPNVNPNITIRQLLNHTSGVNDPLFISPMTDTIMANPTRVFTPQDVLGYLGAPIFAPGNGWYYSNVNYILAGMVAQSATGMHISQLIRNYLLTPLNLTNTYYDVEEPVLGTIAHRWFNSVDFNDTSRVGLNSAGGAAGSIFSTSADMIKWYNALFTGQVLSPSSMAALTTFVNTFGPAYTYGLGLENQMWFGHNTYAHGGRTWGYKSRMLHDPCMAASVCGLANSDPAGMDGVTLLLLRVIINHVPGCPGTITGLANVCQGQNSVTYTVPAIAHATSYVWTLPNGATGTSATNSITVNYGASAISGSITVRGNNSYGVGNVTSLAVNVNPLPAGAGTISGTATVCQGQTSVTYTVPAIANASSYIWTLPNNVSGTSNTNSITVNYGQSALSGNITVKGTNSCGNGAIATLAITVNPIPPTPTISAGSATTFCTGGSVTLTSSSASGNQWHLNGNPIGGATNQAYAANASGNYSVVVTSIGCASSPSPATIVTVNSLPAATISANGSTTFCEGGSVMLTASAGNSYFWNDGSTTQSINVSSSGNYTVAVIGSNGCSAASSPTFVNVNPSPIASTISAGGPTTFCNGNAVTLSGNNGGVWSTGSTSPTINVTSSGTYFVTNSNSCGDVNSNSIVVTVNNCNTIPTTQLQASDCGKLNYKLLTNNRVIANFVGVGTYEFEFTNTATQAVSTIQGTNTIYLNNVTPALTAPGQYSVKVRFRLNGVWGSFGNACTIGIIIDAIPTDTKLRTADCGRMNYGLNSNNRLIADYVGAGTYEFEFSNPSTQVVVATWQGINTLYLNNVTPTLVAPAQYNVRVRARINNVWGNFGTTCLIGIASAARESGIEDHASIAEGLSFNLNVYPNPFSNQSNLFIQSTINDKVQVQIFDMIGSVVWNQQVNTNQNIPVGNEFAKGSYLVKALNTNGEQAIFRMVKVE